MLRHPDSVVTFLLRLHTWDLETGKGCPETSPSAHCADHGAERVAGAAAAGPQATARPAGPARASLRERCETAIQQPLYLSSPDASGLFTPACQLLQARATLTEGEPAGNGRGSPFLQNTEASRLMLQNYMSKRAWHRSHSSRRISTSRCALRMRRCYA